MSKTYCNQSRLIYQHNQTDHHNGNSEECTGLLLRIQIHRIGMVIPSGLNLVDRNCKVMMVPGIDENDFEDDLTTMTFIRCICTVG